MRLGGYPRGAWGLPFGFWGLGQGDLETTLRMGLGDYPLGFWAGQGGLGATL